jgi:hypothetical protein
MWKTALVEKFQIIFWIYLDMLKKRTEYIRMTIVFVEIPNGHLPNTNQKRYNVGFEIFTAVTMKNGVFWVVTPCGSYKNRRFGGT